MKTLCTDPRVRRQNRHNSTEVKAKKERDKYARVYAGLKKRVSAQTPFVQCVRFHIRLPYAG